MQEHLPVKEVIEVYSWRVALQQNSPPLHQGGYSELRTLVLKLNWPCTEVRTRSLLCATSVSSVSLWFSIVRKNNHRDTENTEVAQRKSSPTDFSCKAS